MRVLQDHEQSLVTKNKDENKDFPAKDRGTQENTSHKPAESSTSLNLTEITGAKRERVTDGEGKPTGVTTDSGGLSASNVKADRAEENTMSLKDIQWEIGSETGGRSGDTNQDIANELSCPPPPPTPTTRDTGENVPDIAGQGTVEDNNTPIQDKDINDSIQLDSFPRDPACNLDSDVGSDRPTEMNGELSKAELEAWKRVEEEAAVRRRSLQAINRNTEETREKPKKSPRKRKLTVFECPRRGSRFSVEHVPESEAGKPSSPMAVASALQSSSSIGTDASESQSGANLNGDANVNDVDNEKDDDVFEDGFDNPCFDFPDDDEEEEGEGEDAAAFPDRPSSIRRSISRPSMHHFQEKHQPEMRRCESTIDQTAAAADVHSVVARKDSVVVMKKKFDKKPKLLKYDESIEQWVKHHMGHEPLLPRPARPNDHLPLSCIVLFCCCNVAFGLAALIFSLKSNKHYEKGDYDEARRTSKISLIMSIVGAVVTLVLVVVLLYVFWPDMDVRRIN